MWLDNKNLAYGWKGGREERKGGREEARWVEQEWAGPCGALEH